MDDTDQLRNNLATWLQTRLVGATAVEVTRLEAPRSGYSAETTVVDAIVTRGEQRTSERFVVRAETPEPAVYPVQNEELDVEIEIQYRAMSAVAAHSTVPVAALIGYEAAQSIIGTQFFVMGYVNGDVPIEDPIYTSDGFFAHASPAQRAALLRNGLQVLAAVHNIDWTTAGLDWLVPDGVAPGLRHQLDTWTAYAHRELGDRVHPLLDETFGWLYQNLPVDPPLGLCWGDPRPGNIIWNDFKVACVTDFEACSIAPPEMDLGWWLMFDRWSHETYGVPRLPGEQTRAEQTEIYESFLGRSVGDTYWYEVFAAARYCAIVVRIMNRYVQRGLMPADQTVWIENPAVTCLIDLLDLPDR